MERPGTSSNKSRVKKRVKKLKKVCIKTLNTFQIAYIYMQVIKNTLCYEEHYDAVSERFK